MNATSAEQASAPVTEDALRSVLLAGERPSRSPVPGPELPKPARSASDGGAAHVTQSWSTCSDVDDHASRNGEKQ